MGQFDFNFLCHDPTNFTLTHRAGANHLAMDGLVLE